MAEQLKNAKALQNQSVLDTIAGLALRVADRCIVISQDDEGVMEPIKDNEEKVDPAYTLSLIESILVTKIREKFKVN